jgi:hypothetical protein
MNHRTLLTTLLATTLGLLASGCARPATAEPEPHSTAAPMSSASAAPALDTRTHGWDLGQWYAYSVKVSSAVSFGPGSNMLDFDFDGLVQITPTAVGPDATTLYIAVANPRIVSRVTGSQPEFDRIASQIGATGCFFTFSGGRVVEMQSPRGLSPTAGNTYREIAAALQFARAARPAARYTAEEYDTTGQYIAEYEQQGPLVWSKQKRSYVSILAAKAAPANAPGRVVPQIEKSEGEIHLLADGRAQTIDLRNTVTIQGAQLPVHSITSVSLKAGPSEPAKKQAPDWAALMSGLVRTGSDEPLGGPATIESLDKARIGLMTFDKAVTGLEEIAKARRGSMTSSVNGASLDADEKTQREQVTEEESKLFIALGAIFREQPETIPRALAKIRAKSPAADTLVEALSAASSPAAQSALIDLAASKALDPLQRNRIFFALSRTPRPDAEAIAALEASLQSDPFNEVALLGLGTFSRRLRDAGDVDKSVTIGDLLVEKLKAAQKTTDRLTALRAVTNAGYAAALPDVIAHLDDGASDEIRVAAVRAVQSMSDPRVDQILVERMQSDRSSDVRMSALAAAKVRPPNDVLALGVEKTALATPDPHVRYRATELLARWLPARPSLRSTLERLAQTDPEARIRDRAQSAL